MPGPTRGTRLTGMRACLWDGGAGAGKRTCRSLAARLPGVTQLSPAGQDGLGSLCLVLDGPPRRPRAVWFVLTAVHSLLFPLSL